MEYKKVGPNHEFRAGDRVVDLLFPEYGPATLEQHPCPEMASNGRNTRDKWIVRFDDQSKPEFWVSKGGEWSQLGVLLHGG